jgi:hypothetical protein
MSFIGYDQRIRREGYDVDLMIEAAGLHPSPVPQIEAVAAVDFSQQEGPSA